MDRYVERLGERAEASLDTGNERYFANEALRALLIARRGDLASAVTVLVNVTRAKPDAAYLAAWSLDWLEPPGAFESIGPDAAKVYVITLLSVFSEHVELTAADEDDARRAASLVQRYDGAYPPDPMIDMAIAGLLRKAGRFDEAVMRARASPPSWASVVAEGLALRAKGEVDSAEDAFGRAVAYDSNDVTAFLEAGDMFFDRELWDRALGWYERALARQPQHPWASASAVRCRASEEDARDELERLASEGNGRAHGLLSRSWPYHGRLPRPSDASANILADVYAQLGGPSKDGGTMKLTVSQVESPSNLVAFRVGLGMDVEVIYQNVTTPDPREPIDTFGFTVWRREGESLVPAIDAEPSEISARIVALATERFDLGRNWAAASRVGRELGADAVDGLLGCIAHPPPPPEGVHPLDWIPRVHLAVAYVLAHVDAGWDDSVRRRALYTLLLGPMDWSTEAAIMTVTELGRRHPAFATDIHDALTRLEAARPRDGHVPWEVTLYSCWRALPNLFPDEEKAIGEKLEKALADPP